MLGQSSAPAVLLLNTGLISKRHGVISFSPIGSRCGHSAADLMLKTCAASAAQFGLPQTRRKNVRCNRGRAATCNILPAGFLQVKNNKACGGPKKTGDHAKPFWHKILAPSRCFPYKKSTEPPFLLQKFTTMSCSADLCCRKSCCSWLTRALFQICKQSATRHCSGFADLYGTRAKPHCAAGTAPTGRP